MKKKVRTSNHSNAGAKKRRAAYSIAAGAATAAVGISAAPAEATIQYSGLYNLSVLNGYAELKWDLDYAPGLLSQDVGFRNYKFGTENYMAMRTLYAPGKFVTSNGSFPYYATALKSGDPINSSTVSSVASQVVLASAINPNDQFENVDNRFIGLSWPDFGPVYYGWLRVKIDRTAGTFLVKDWAYDDTGAGILAGNTGSGFVPEPGTLGMLAAGSAGLLALRRRRKEAA